MRRMTTIIMLIIAPVAIQAASFKVTGQVFRSDTKQPVSYASVLIKQGTNILQIFTTEDDGRFNFENLPSGKLLLIAKQAGFYSEDISLDMKGNRRVTVYLVPAGTMTMGEIEVLGEKQRGTVSKNIITKEMRQKATTSITGDPLNVLSKMPGVENSGFSLNSGMGSSSSGRNATSGGGQIGGLSGVSVRAGGADENTALLDNVQIPYPYHSFMPDSVFIDALIGDIIVYKGIYSPRYGQAMSSLLDVSMDKAAAGFHGTIDIGLLNAYIAVNGASTNGKWSYLGGIKRTHYDLIVPLFFTLPAGVEVTIPYYLDSHGAVRYKTKMDSAYFLWQLSGEPGKIVNPGNTNVRAINATLDTWHAVANTTWRHKFNKNLSLDQAADYSFTGNYRHVELPNTLFLNDSTEQYFRYKAFGDININENINLKIGGEELYYPSLFYTNYTRNIRTNFGGSTNITSSHFRGSYGMTSGFLDSDISFLEKFHFAGGLRTSYADLINRWSMEPRTTLEYFFQEKNKVYIAWGYQSQFPSDPSTVARLNSVHSELQVPTVQHGVFGSQIKMTPTIGVTAEGYIKKYANLLATMSNKQQELDTAGYDRDIYGFDILIQKMPDTFPLYGWIGFSRFTAWDKFTHGFYMTSINSLRSAFPPVGVWYDGDSTDYKVDVTAVYEITKNWSFTSEFAWHSGAAYTPVIGSTLIGTNNQHLPVFGAYDSARFEDGHQLNLKLEWRGRRWGHIGGVYFQVNNVYNHKPVTSIRWNSDYTVKEEIRSFFGIYPIVGFWMEW